MAKAKTKKGLKVKVSILDKVYETGRKYAAGLKKTMKIVFDEFLPKWNYRAVPQPGEIGKLFPARSLVFDAESEKNPGNLAFFDRASLCTRASFVKELLATYLDSDASCERHTNQSWDQYWKLFLDMIPDECVAGVMSQESLMKY